MPPGRTRAARNIPAATASTCQGAWLRIYPDSAHGFPFQQHVKFAAGVGAFLAAAG